MAWLRVSDTVADDPRTLHPLELEDADDRIVDEVFGFSARLAARAASAGTDRRITRGMALANAWNNPSRMQRLMRILEAAGVWVKVEGGWELVNDSNYFHLRSQDEIERDSARKKDATNDSLTVQARLRDGDACRYCAKTVNWNDRKSLRGATWEHVNIANQPTRLHEFVVCCFGCNREPESRGPLLPAPGSPRYGARTKEFVKSRLGKWPTKAEIDAMYPDLRTTPGSASGDQRPGREDAAIGQRPRSDNAVKTQRPGAENATQNSTKPVSTLTLIPAKTGRQNEREAAQNPSSKAEPPPADPGPVDTGSAGSRFVGSGRGSGGSSTNPQVSPTRKRSRRTTTRLLKEN